VLEAAIRRGAHYLDCTGEPRYVLKLIELYDAPARAAGSAIIPSSGLGTCANLVARVAARDLERVERITIDYRIRRMRPSSGTTCSTMQILVGGAAVLDRGQIRFRAPGSRVRRLEGGTGVLFPLTDTLTCSRLWPQASIESYIRMPVAAAASPPLLLAGLAGRSKLVTNATERAARALLEARAAPSRGEFEVTVTASGAGRRATAVGRVADVYEITSQAAFELARTVLERKPEPGFRASGEIAGEPEEVARRIGLELQL
jgi:hypothetical protein